MLVFEKVVAAPLGLQAQCPGTLSFSVEGDFKIWPRGGGGTLLFGNRGVISFPPTTLGIFSFSTPINDVVSASFEMEG